MWESWEKQIITMGFVSLFYGGIPLVFGNPEFIPFESFYNTTKAGVESNVVLRAFGGEIVLTKHALICARYYRRGAGSPCSCC